jgi:hypothetical protein
MTRFRLYSVRPDHFSSHDVYGDNALDALCRFYSRPCTGLLGAVVVTVDLDVVESIIGHRPA